MHSPADEDRGFTLAEVLAAMTMIAVALTGVAALIVLAVRVAAGAEHQTMAAMLAAQKMEELRPALAAVVPAPGGSLQASLPGFSEGLDAAGRPAPGAAAVYVRRWTVAPVAGLPDVGLVQVLVGTVVRDRHIAAAGGTRMRHPDEALLATFTGKR